MHFQILGPIAASGPDGPLDLGGPRQRRLLAALLAHNDTVVPTDRLVEIVFEGQPPSGASTTIRSYIARLRKALADVTPPAELSTGGGGYRLTVPPESLDAQRFSDAVGEAKSSIEAGQSDDAVGVLRSALGLWRGDALGEFSYEEWTQPEVARLTELRLFAQELFNDAMLRCGLATDVVAATSGQIAEHPLRESFRRQHILGLYRTGRQTEALRSAEEFSRALIDVGLEPSEEFRTLEAAVAAHDPSIRLDSPAGLPLRGYRLLGPVADEAHQRAVQPGTGRQVAIKVVPAHLANQPGFAAEFESMLRTAASVEHPHLVPVYDYWRDPDGAFVVQRLFESRLAHQLEDGPLDLDRVEQIAREIGGASVALSDRGCAPSIDAESIFFDGEHYYLENPPASALSDGRPDRTSGQSQLAAVLSHALLGVPPHVGQGAVNGAPVVVHAARPKVPAEVDDVLGHAFGASTDGPFDSTEEFVDRFTEALTGRSTPLVRSAAPTPFRGLRAFGESDESVFYGRAETIEEILDKMRVNDDRFTVAVGASGIGKSSVIRAGVIPALRAGAIDGSEQWRIVTMVPGSEPMAELSEALRSVASESTSQETSSVAELIEAAIGDSPLLLLIDQLEELFTTTSEANCLSFATGLSAALESDRIDLRILATLRADFYDRPLRYAELGRLVKSGTVTILPLSAAEMEQAITRPAATVNAEVEPGLVSALVADLIDRPAALPLLQFALTELYEARSGNLMQKRDYDRLGGVEAVVARRAESLYETMPDSSEDQVRSLFLQLVQVDEAGAVSRRRVVRSEISGDRDTLDGILESFGAARLLTFDQDPATREPTVEIAHEAITTQWPRLAQWLAESGDDLRVRGLLRSAALEWDQRGRDDSDLYRGLRLEAANQLTAQAAGTSKLENEFLAASASAQLDRERTEQRRTERERESNQRLRRLLTGVAVLLVLAMVSAGLAITQQRRAAEEARTAELATLMSRSAAQTSSDPEVALLLALEANRRSPSSETSQSVLNALGSARLPKVLSTVQPLKSTCEPDVTFLIPEDRMEYAVVEGRLMSQNVTTAEITDHGAAPAGCTVWAMDQSTGRTFVGTLDARTGWFGTVDNPTAIERKFDRQQFVFPGSIAGGVIPFLSNEPNRDVITLFDLDSGEQIGEPVGSGGFVNIAFDPSGSFLAVSFSLIDQVDGIGRIHVVDLKSGEEVHVIDSNEVANALAFDPQTLELLAGLSDSTVQTVDLITGEVVSVVSADSSSWPQAVGVRPDGLVTYVSPGLVEVIDRRIGPTASPVPVSNFSQVTPLDDGTILFLTGNGVDVVDVQANALVDRIWDADPRARTTFNAGMVSINNEATQRTEILNLTTGQRRTWDLELEDGSRFGAETVHPETFGVTAIDERGSIVRWDESGEIIDRIDFPNRILTQTRMDDLLAVITWDPELGTSEARLLDMSQPEMVEVVSISEPGLESIHPTADRGMHLIFENGRVDTYDSTGELVETVETGVSDALIVTLDATTGALALADFGPEQGLVLIEDGEVTRLAQGEPVSNLGFAQDGRLLAITGADGSVRLWDTERREPAGTGWQGTGANFGSPSWYDESIDSIWVFTSSKILAIPLNPDDWTNRACAAVGRPMTQDEWDRLVPGAGIVIDACADTGS